MIGPDKVRLKISAMRSGISGLGRRQRRLLCAFVWAAAAAFGMIPPALGQSIEAQSGSWSGQGEIVIKGTSKEDIKCKAYNVGRNGQLRLVIRCASAGGGIAIRFKMKRRANNYSGHWEEHTHNGTGDVKGRSVDSALARASTGHGRGIAKKLAELLQYELKRVGCYPGTIDGDWGPGSRAALEAFNQHARTAFPTSYPSPPPIIQLHRTFARACRENNAPETVAATSPNQQHLKPK